MGAFGAPRGRGRGMGRGRGAGGDVGRGVEMSYDADKGLRACISFYYCVGYYAQQKVTRFFPDQLRRFFTEVPKFKEMVKELAERERISIGIPLDEISIHTDNNTLSEKIASNTQRYLHLCQEVLDNILLELNLPVPKARKDVHDVLTAHRMVRAQNNLGPSDTTGADASVKQQFPSELVRRYEAHFIPSSSTPTLPLRELRAGLLGHLVQTQAIVTRVNEVKPFLKVATYTCEQCQQEVFQVIRGRSFLPLTKCTSKACQGNAHPGLLTMETRGSKFTKFQEIKIQEMMEHVPTGQTPRSLTVLLQGELTQLCTPGDIITVSGIFLPIPSSTSGGKSLTADTFLDAQTLEVQKKSFSNIAVAPDTEDEIRSLSEKYSKPELYELLASSIAPGIYGHVDIKKAVLLQMVGSPTRTLPDGMKIRGELNVIIIGDPGVAKSQLLKYVANVAPRAVYTTGKGASGVGLTAAVLKDPITNEFLLEGGSLVLADMGICCIDEFDKMSETDRTSIHEVMEQQTVSVAKAGITTNLNARTSVLAAANPAYGRYDLKKSPSNNINMPAALLSRFDILFITLDKPDPESDRRLAEHITHVHLEKSAPTGQHYVGPDSLRAYIAMCKLITPTIPKELTDYLVNKYIEVRQGEVGNASQDVYYYTSARTLLGTMRLALAHARLRLSPEVAQEDIEEAIRLLNSSKATVQREKEKRFQPLDNKSEIYETIKTFYLQHRPPQINSGIDVSMDDADANPIVHLIDVQPLLLRKGFLQPQIDATLSDYERLGVWSVSQDRSLIKFLTS
ncbi:Mcm2-7 hexameric complex component [Pelomyxa schiedti]|nr:Mcm2-7 hexameric complex component [Pelomyxa schiedti]